MEFHTLDLSKNFIGDEGVCSFISFFFCFLRVCISCPNQASWIAELLGANDSITICDLRSNDFTAKGFDAIFAVPYKVA